MTFRGSIVALVTPFRDGRLDLPGVEALVDLHLQSGTRGIVSAGTTGEAPTLSPDESFQLVRAVAKRCAGKIPVIAGVGTHSTDRTLQNLRAAEEAGADAHLVVSPYYNKPTQGGLVLHFEAVAAASKRPIVLYNIPGRTGVNLTPETIARLARTPRIAAIKEAAGSIDQVMQIRAQCDLPILSGDDAMTYPMMALGAVGVISVAANVVPKDVAALCEQALAGDLAKARAIHERLLKLFRALFLETNPIPVKTALRLMGRIDGSLRLPLCPMAAENEANLKAVLREYGMI